MKGIPPPQGTHRVFNSEDEHEQSLETLTLTHQKSPEGGSCLPAKQQASSEEPLSKELIPLETIVKDVAEHTVSSSSHEIAIGKCSTRSSYKGYCNLLAAYLNILLTQMNLRLQSWEFQAKQEKA